jgi:hypothetical protein
MAAPVLLGLPFLQPIMGGMGMGNMITNSAPRQKVAVPVSQTQVPPVSVTKLHYVPPNAGVASSAWTSSGTFLDFELPKSFNVINKTTLQLEINVDSQNPVTNCPPSPFLIQQVEVYVGSQLVETLYPNDIYNEMIGFLKIDEMLSQSPSLAYNPGKVIDDTLTNALVPAEVSATPAPANIAHTTSLKTGLNYIYLPFNNCLTTCGFNCGGLVEAVKYRVYFPSSMFAAGAAALQTANLVLEEYVGTSADRRAWEIASNAGTVFSTLVRQRMNTVIQKQGASDYTLELTGLNGSSAGFMIYAGPPVNAGSGNTDFVPFTDASGNQTATANNILASTRYVIDNLTLQDQVGNKRTELLRGEHLLNFVWPRHIGSSFNARPESQTYLLPFCVNFRDALETGVYQGHLRTNGRDRLVIGGTPHNATMTTDNWSFTVTNYAYTGLVVKNGRLVEILRNPHAGDYF